MALDWEPLPTPKRGFEREFNDIFKKLVHATSPRREQLMEWLGDVAQPAFTTIGAPRVGFDDDANAWLRARAEKSDRLGELGELEKEMHGYSVLELMPPCEGFPVYSRYKDSEVLERYAFHAQLLADVRDVLGDELCRRAATMMLPEAHEEFAIRLFEVADRYATENSFPTHVATIREPVFPEGTPERKGHIIYAAAKWCAYWSKRGHGLLVWL